MTSNAQRLFRVAIETTSFDLVLTATADTGVAKIAGRCQLLHDPTNPAAEAKDFGAVDVTIWGSTLAQLKSRAKTWPERFDAIPADYFGVSSDAERRFDIFLASDRFVNVVHLMNAALGGQVVIDCDVSDNGEIDFVHHLEISAVRS